jgi:hypothetical protein
MCDRMAEVTRYLFIGEFAIFQVLTHLVPYLQI